MITTIIIIIVIEFLIKWRDSLDYDPKKEKEHKENRPLRIFFGFCLITIVSGIFVASREYTEEDTTTSDTESKEIYALKDSASQESRITIYNGIFIISGTTSTWDGDSTYKYCVEDTVDGRKVKKITTLTADAEDVFFDDTLEDASKARLDVITTKEKKGEFLKHPENKLWYASFIPGSMMDEAVSILSHEHYTETQYIFVVPQGSITNEIDIDME